MLKDADDLKAADIQQLVTDSVSEKLTIEYKSELPGWGDSDKKEFLADISSFANSAGGHIFYGVRDRRENNKATGIPESAPGLAGVGSETTGRIEQILRDGISPRINGIKVRLIPGFQDGPVLVIQVPKSWNPPHAVWLDKNSKFWARDSHGKVQLNVDQIGAAFLATDSASRRIRDFRIERIAAIGAGETPVPLRSGRRLTVHLVPLSTLNSREVWPASQLEAAAGQKITPLSYGGWSDRINLDGFLRYSVAADSPSWGYVQLYRNGAIEACDTTLLGAGPTAEIPSLKLEQGLISGLGRFLQAQRSLGLAPPIALMISLEGVRGLRLAVTRQSFFLPGGRDHVIDRDKLLLSELLIEDYQQSPDRILHPVFDAISNAAGFESCPRYKAGGEYDPSLAQ